MKKPELYRAIYIGKIQNVGEHFLNYGMTGAVDLRYLCQEYIDNIPQYRFNADSDNCCDISWFVDTKDLYFPSL